MVYSHIGVRTVTVCLNIPVSIAVEELLLFSIGINYYFTVPLYQHNLLPMAVVEIKLVP